MTSLEVVAVGEFGRAIGGCLRELKLGGQEVRLNGLGAREDLVAVLERGSVGVLASRRDDTHVADAMDAAAWTAHRPWLSVVHQDPYLRVGPVIVPPSGPCFACYRVRAAQQAGSGWFQDDLDRAYRANGALGVKGLPPHLLRIGSGLAAALIDGIGPGNGGELAGRMFYIDTRTDRIRSAHVVPAHNCSRCSRYPGARDRQRWLKSLADDLRASQHPRGAD